MKWDYRLLKDLEGHYEITEFYYDEDGLILGWCPASAPSGESFDEALEDYRMMNEAFYKPIIEMPVGIPKEEK